MDTSWKHQKDAITTDQKNRVDDEHIHEVDKRHLKENESETTSVPKRGASKTRSNPNKSGTNAPR